MLRYKTELYCIVTMVDLVVSSRIRSVQEIHRLEYNHVMTTFVNRQRNGAAVEEDSTWTN